MLQKPVCLANYETIKHTVFDTAALEEEKAGLQEEMNVVAEMIQQCINENARIALNQTDYQMRYDALAERFEKAKARLEAVSMEITEKQAHRQSTERFIAELSKIDSVITEFDEDFWFSMINYVTIFNKEDVRFTFQDGTEIRV